ncbi:MAG: hypothetical protein Tsb002_03530 [Wenzhouxiangellaceae bacterium]
MSRTRHPRNQGPAVNIPAENVPAQSGRKPDFIAYQVQQGQDGQAYFNKIGAAWQHKDGEGYELDLAAVPVDGRISLRTLRENRMQDYRDQQAGQAPPEMSQNHEPQR